MEFDTIKDAFDRVTKKQKLSSSKSQEVIGQIYHELEQVLQKIQLADNPECQLDLNSIFSEFKTKLKDIAPLTQLESTQKELNVALTKYPKLIEKSFNPDISKAYRNVDFDRHTVNQIIASHFYRQGMFELGDCFISEAGESESASSLRSPLQEMYQILEAMKSRNLEPALNWALNNANKLQESGSDLLLKLHSMQFMEILLKDERHDALKYARTYLAPLASHHMAELQKLMACLLWSGKLECSPYSQLQLLSAANWDKVAEELIRQFCNFLGQSYESPLGITVAAGIQGLPPLLKFMNVMVGKRQEWQTMKQLPVPVELDKEFQFHSIFVCPVSKEESTEENPPMLMICGHVLCKQSIMKMSKNSTKSFKCPYCPTDIDASRCRPLYF